MNDKEKLFLKLVEGFQWKHDLVEYPNSLFAFRDDIFIFEITSSEESINPRKIISSYRLGILQDLKNAEIWFNYDKIWSIFESKFEMEYSDIQSFMKDMLETHFKMRANTTSTPNMNKHFKLETHFKMRANTTTTIGVV